MTEPEFTIITKCQRCQTPYLIESKTVYKKWANAFYASKLESIFFQFTELRDHKEGNNTLLCPKCFKEFDDLQDAHLNASLQFLKNNPV